MRLARRKTSLSPRVKYFTDRSKAVLLLWIFYVFYALRLLCLCARLFICALWSPAGKRLTSWLSFVVSCCECVTFPLVSRVRYGTWLYRFLIFAPLLTFKQRNCLFGPNLRLLEADFLRIIYQKSFKYVVILIFCQNIILVFACALCLFLCQTSQFCSKMANFLFSTYLWRSFFLP